MLHLTSEHIANLRVLQKMLGWDSRQLFTQKLFPALCKADLVCLQDLLFSRLLDSKRVVRAFVKKLMLGTCVQQASNL